MKQPLPKPLAIAITGLCAGIVPITTAAQAVLEEVVVAPRDSVDSL